MSNEWVESPLQELAIHTLIHLLTPDERGLIMRNFLIVHPNAVRNFSDRGATSVLTDSIAKIQLRGKP